MKSDKYYIFCISIIKSLKFTSQVTIIMKENVIAIRDPKPFYFDFDCAEDVDENLKHGID